MDIIVCLKQTFSMEEKVVIHNGRVSEEGIEFIINPYDEYAIEEALKLRETHGGEITAISAGPDRVESALRTALAMGVDHAIHVAADPGGLDEYGTSLILAGVIRTLKYDLILAGNMSIDKGASQVAVRLAEELDLPQVTTITGLQIEGAKALAERDLEGGKEWIEVSLPAVLTAQQGLNDPRYPSLPGIMKAKKKTIERIEASAVMPSGQSMTKTKILEVFLPAPKKAGRILTGSAGETASELVRLLSEEAKIS